MTDYCNLERDDLYEISDDYPGPCRLTGNPCDRGACILQRILAMLPMNSPIVAQSYSAAIGSGPEDALPANISVTTKAEGSRTYTHAEAASKLRLTSAGITYRANKLKVGTKVGCHLIFSEEDLIKLSRKRGGQRDIGKHPKEPKPGKEKHQVDVEIKKEVELVEGTDDPDMVILFADGPVEEPTLEEVHLLLREHAHQRVPVQAIQRDLGGTVENIRQICDELCDGKHQVGPVGTDEYTSRDPLSIEELVALNKMRRGK